MLNRSRGQDPSHGGGLVAVTRVASTLHSWVALGFPAALWYSYACSVALHQHGLALALCWAVGSTSMRLTSVFSSQVFQRSCWPAQKLHLGFLVSVVVVASTAGTRHIIQVEAHLSVSSLLHVSIGKADTLFIGDG